MLKDMLVFVQVPTVGKADVLKAWSYAISDFEDALQVACAEAEGVAVIVTRNVADFANSPIKALTPEDFLQKHGPQTPRP